MSKSKLSPYLNFNGNCEEAMKFYQQVLGGELSISRFSDFNSPVPDDYKHNVMHASLDNDTLSFMASDSAPGRNVTFGDNVHMSVVGTDEAQLTKFFTGLSEGGAITMPLEKQVWGDKFGMLTDKFGVHWMINIDGRQHND